MTRSADSGKGKGLYVTALSVVLVGNRTSNIVINVCHMLVIFVSGDAERYVNQVRLKSDCFLSCHQMIIIYIEV